METCFLLDTKQVSIEKGGELDWDRQLVWSRRTALFCLRCD